MWERFKRRWIGRSGVAAVSLALALCACSQPASQARAGSQDGTRPFKEMFAQQDLCDPAWRKIYTQWMDNGGGIKASIIKTREQLEADKKSILARIIRKVWNSSTDPRAGKDRLWDWPINEDKSRQLSFVFGDASKEYVPSTCATIIWLPSMVWDNLRFVDGNPLKFRMPSEAPPDVNWNSHTAPNWTLYWLLVRMTQ